MLNQPAMKHLLFIFITCLFLSACASAPNLVEGTAREPVLAKKCQKTGQPAYQQLQCAGDDESDGRKEGLWCCFDASHRLLMASEFQHGLKNGRAELYSGADGHLETISTWRAGQLEGPQINFNHNGTPLTEYFLHDNRFDGEMKDYDGDGRLLSVRYYQNGVCLDPDRLLDGYE